MKKVITLMAAIAVCLTMNAQTETINKSWTFTSSPSSTDVANITADAANWKKDSKSRYCYINSLDNAALTANGQPISLTEGLNFTATANSNGNIRIAGSTKSLWLGNACKIIIPARQKGDVVTITYMTSNKSATRNLGLENIEGTFPATTGKTQQTGYGKVTADGDVTFIIEGGMYFYTLAVQDSASAEDNPQGGGDDPGNPDNPNDQKRGMTYTGGSINTPAPLDSAVVWCAPIGDDATADGSETKPYFDLQLAVNKAKPGTTIKMKAGNYVYSKRININDRNGRSDAYITVMCPDGRAVLDFSGMPYHPHSDNPYQGIRLTSSYWHFYKIDITNASDNGMLIERSKPTGGSAQDVINRNQDAHDNIIEFCNFYKNGDTGLQMKNLASFNYVLNCDAYENKDEGDGDADGFAPKISVGDGNYFYGCRAYNNSDDGYDVFFKKDGGFQDNKTIVFENCLAYENGFINGVATKGNMNGFKCGSKQGRMNVVLNRCIAVNNGSKGFDQNHNSGDIIMNNCTGYSLLSFNGGKNAYSYRIYEALADGSICELTNCIAINDYSVKEPTDKGEYGSKKETKYGRVNVSAASKSVTNDWTCSEANFRSMDDYETLIGERQADGNLNWDNITWGHPKQDNAVVVDKGTAVSANSRYEASGVAVPAIEYSGAAPDLGAFEQGLIAKKVNYATADAIETISQAPGSKKVSLVQAFNGMVIVNVNGGIAHDQYTISAYSTNGSLLGQHKFNGTNTSIYLPAANGVVLLKVTGNGVDQTIKAVMK